MPTGRDLQREREQRGISTEQISAGTRISVRHLEALEAELYDELPGGVFSKGILRSYCGFLSLDPEPWLTRFTEETTEPASEEDWQEFARNVSRNRPGGDAVRHRWWGVLVLWLALAALGWAAWRFILRPRVGPLSPKPQTVAQSATRATQ